MPFHCFWPRSSFGSAANRLLTFAMSRKQFIVALHATATEAFHETNFLFSVSGGRGEEASKKQNLGIVMSRPMVLSSCCVVIIVRFGRLDEIHKRVWFALHKHATDAGAITRSKRGNISIEVNSFQSEETSPLPFYRLLRFSLLFHI